LLKGISIAINSFKKACHAGRYFPFLDHIASGSDNPVNNIRSELHGTLLGAVLAGCAGVKDFSEVLRPFDFTLQPGINKPKSPTGGIAIKPEPSVGGTIKA
jgi:hypothetical protein